MGVGGGKGRRMRRGRQAGAALSPIAFNWITTGSIRSSPSFSFLFSLYLSISFSKHCTLYTHRRPWQGQGQGTDRRDAHTAGCYCAALCTLRHWCTGGRKASVAASVHRLQFVNREPKVREWREIRGMNGFLFPSLTTDAMLSSISRFDSIQFELI